MKSIAQNNRNEALRKAALHRAESVDARIRDAMRDLDAEGKRVDFVSVARKAGVSRQSLYSRETVRLEIQKLRDVHDEAPATKRPVRERASDESVKVRLHVALDENKQLRTEVGLLKAEVRALRGRLGEMLSEMRNAH